MNISPGDSLADSNKGHRLVQRRWQYSDIVMMHQKECTVSGCMTPVSFFDHVMSLEHSCTPMSPAELPYLYHVEYQDP